VSTSAALLPIEADLDAIEQVGLWKDAWTRFRRNRLAIIGGTVVLLLVLDAFLAPVLEAAHLIANPLKQDPVNLYASASWSHPMGLDALGRDLMSRLMFGAQISLTIGVLVQGIIVLIGLSIGLTAGYFGGKIDNLLMRFTDVWFAFPDLLFVLVLVSVFGASELSIFAAIGLVNWVNLARIVRGLTLSLREREFVEAARAVGSSPLRIISRHIFPNILGPVIVTITFGIPQAIFTEAVLSYLGVGIPPPTPSWGTMIHDGYEAINYAPMQAGWPAIAIAITMLAFTFLGDGLRDALDPRMRK
jgi:oligopeptide transport system permease protein